LTVPDHLAVVLTAEREVECREVPIPEVGAHDLLVRVIATGICGSDLATYRGTHPYKKAPVVLGHELCGEVVEIGASVRGARPRDRVCSAAFAACGACADCRRGATNLCSARANLSHGDWAGSFASHVLLRDTMVFPLDAGVHPEAGAMAEPLAIAVHAARLATAGTTVAVLGAGGIGLCCAIAAEQLGLGEITCVDLGPDKARLAALAGATYYVDAAAAGAVTGVLGTHPRGVDVTFVATGYPGVLDDARAITRPGGEVIVVSYFDRPQEVTLNPFVSAELTVRFSALCTARDFADVTGWLADGSVDPRGLITHRFPMRDAALALRLMDRSVGQVGKIMLHTSSEGDDR
jgi:2-desacetyl-2-hydroxyethyl bacteriochlorophyllide A dehydrogenase